MRQLDSAKLIALLADDELAEFARLCEIGGPGVSREELQRAVNGLEPRAIVDAFIAAKGATLTMMSDVFRIIARHGVALRTTGCLLVLPGDTGLMEHAFSKQALSMLAAFSEDWSTSDHRATYSRLQAVVDRVLRPWAEHAMRHGQPRSRMTQRMGTGLEAWRFGATGSSKMRTP